jgi:RpiB/LacA/LacB family sugar-phosphate isomerase
MNIAIGTDHRGERASRALAKHLRESGHQVEVLHDPEGQTADYPDGAYLVGTAVARGRAERGILVCSNGVGMTIAANKIPGVRAALVGDQATAQQSRRHNDANVLCLGGRFIREAEAFAIADAWLETGFEGGRHARRVAKIAGIETRAEATAAVRHEIEALDALDVPARIWSRDPLVFTPEAGTDEPTRRSIGTRLGWLEAPHDMADKLEPIARLRAHAATLGLTDAVLFGMGGSSLAPEVLATTFGAQASGLRLHVLDNTDPEAVAEVEAAVAPERTLFIVASKSGSTIEVSAFERHFWELAKTQLGEVKARERFAAITDPGTGLAETASARYAHVFLNDPHIGGRFSALSYFGLVPAGLLGLDVPRLVASAAAMAKACRAPRVTDNPGARLGAWMGALARRGRNKLTLVLAPEIASFGAWIEQLVAESTGKQGKGILPVDREPLGSSEVYGADRAFVVMTLQGGAPAAPPEALASIRAAGHPVEEIEIATLYDLGAEMFRWEMATAVAGASLRLNPFDEPNVKEAKDATGEALEAVGREGRLPAPEIAPAAPTDAAAIGAHLGTAGDGDYIALCAFFRRTGARDELLGELRTLLRDRLRVPVTIGYGPRFLHSTGQLHKGGPNEGVFLQLTADAPAGAAIPGLGFDFRTLRDAQALGDFKALRRRGRRLLRVHLGGEAELGLDRLRAAAAALPIRART